MQANVHAQLLPPGRHDPGRPCLVLDERVLTYGEVDDRSARFARALDERGCRVGDRAVVQVDKSSDAVALYLACLRRGIVFVPLNPTYTPAEIQFFVDDARPTLFVGRPHDPPPSRTAATTLGADGDGELAAHADGAEPLTDLVERSGDDWAAMLYTSGTTGRSKGAKLSCGNLVSNARALSDAWRFTADDVLLHVLPVFHVHGLFVALHCAFLAGAAVRFHHRFGVEHARRELLGSTVLMGVPTHYHRLLADPHFGPDDCRTMRLFTSGSAPLPAADHEEFGERTGHRIVERYGMTETMILTSNPYDGDRVPGTVGFALPGVGLRVVDEAGVSVPPGEPGTVEVQGPGVFLGYHELPELTAAAFRPDGWFVTGDVGTLDHDGRLALVGRGSDTIISGGLNIYPKEIELVLDAVDGVDESAVIGLPDPEFGEAVVAVVVPAAGAALDDSDLMSACDTSLARFKHPRRYVRVDELPRNAMGKIQKSELRRMLQDEPGPTT